MPSGGMGGRNIARYINGRGGTQSYEDRIMGAIPGAQRMTAALGAAGPQDFGQFIEPGLQQAIRFNLDEGGMPQQAYDQSRTRLGQGLNTALSRNAAVNARRGLYNPGSVASSSRPAFANFGGQLASLEAERANLRQRAVTQAGQQLTSLAPIAASQTRAAQEGFGEFVRQGSRGPRLSISRGGARGRAY